MSLTTYNFFWGMVKFILPSYLEGARKKGRKTYIELMKDLEFQKIIDQMVLSCGYMAPALVSQLQP